VGIGANQGIGARVEVLDNFSLIFARAPADFIAGGECAQGAPSGGAQQPALFGFDNEFGAVMGDDDARFQLLVWGFVAAGNLVFLAIGQARFHAMLSSLKTQWLILKR